MEIDPVTTSVINQTLQATTDEMNISLVKAAYSSNIKSRRDCSSSIYDKKGNMLAQGLFIPVHLGIMSNTIKGVLEKFPMKDLEPGDAIIHNDPFRMGSHLYDIMVFAPIFYDEKPIAMGGCLAHHVDVGGRKGIAYTKDVNEEGIRIPPTKIRRQGKIEDDIIDILKTNSRTSHDVKGDLKAQMGANYRAEREIKKLAERYGVDTLENYFEEILNYSDRGMRSSIRDMPKGQASFEDYIEFNGVEKEEKKIKANVKINDDNIHIDFDGSDGPSRGNVNSPWSITLSATYFAVKAVVAPNIPTNRGAYRSIDVKRPDGASVVDAKYPRAVGNCTNNPSVRIIDSILGAFSKLVPKKVCAASQTWPILNLEGQDPRKNRYYSYVETYAGGRGAKYNEDGATAHHTNMTNTRNAAWEVIEADHPIRVNKYAIRENSEGAGKYRGGLGMIREMEPTQAKAFAFSLAWRNKRGPYGLFGGESAATAETGIIRKSGEVEEKRVVYEYIEPGEKVFMKTSGGGGFGNPLEREPEKVKEDVKKGYISIERARNTYGVVIDPETLEIDSEKTEKIRAKKGKKKNEL